MRVRELLSLCGCWGFAMAKTKRILLEETNVISLRVGYISDRGELVSARLMPGWMESSVPSDTRKSDISWVLKDSIYLYRNPRSEEAAQLMAGSSWIEEYLRLMVFEKDPHFKLTWTDSGNGLAVHLNGEPWAFIDERTQQGYSKGILKPTPRHLSSVGNQWNQRLYETTFL